ncbi:G-protein coupled receptor GRL101-like [Pocillopora verrucosa]|uniref:G-protein coupled receptor GRL101-like n=1 Tax=Pocillopora verrucosa TaxID=203993 RepID=UPI003340328F
MSPSDEPFTIRTPATAPTQFTRADSTATPITTPPSTPSSTPWSTPWSTPLNTPFTTPITTPKTSPTSLFIIYVEYKQWKITVPEGNYVEMTIKNINLRPWACFFETYIMVRDGHSLSDNVLRILCEASTSPHRITSSGNKMIVERYGTLGTSEGAGFEASFKAKPLKTGDSPSFGVAEETVALLEHCSQSLLCQAGGAPAPRITWSKNGEVLQNSTSVTYTPRWHSKSGNYTCRASNFNGSDTKTILVHTEKCSRFCRCYKLNSHPFWLGVVCWASYEGTVPRDIPLATRYLLFFADTSLWHISPKSFENLSDLQYLWIEGEFHPWNLTRNAFGGLKQLKNLKISNHYSLDIEEGTFNDLTSLESLDLRENRISRIAEGTFEKLFSLEELYISINELSKLPPNIFPDPSELRVLDISYNKISSLSKPIFDKLQSLETLVLSHNEIVEIPANVFSRLNSLKTLRLQNNFLYRMPPETFSYLKSLRNLKMDSFSLCCYASLHLEKVSCEYPKLEGNALSSCNRMIDASGPRRSIWLLGILAVVGNLAVIAWRLIRRDDHPVQTCLLTNLAVADFLMGVYLMIIAIKDQIWAGTYFSFDLIWRSGVQCKVAGALSVLSSEVSVLMLTVITADRLLSIVFAFRCSRLTLRGTYIICTMVWLCGTAIAVVPALDTPYFFNEERRYGFYGRSSVCLPLQLSSERLAGWEYSVGVFIGLNLAAFLFIMLAYISIIVKVSKSQRRVKAHGESEVSLNSIKRESALARRVLAIILTDFSCWIPVIILSILALTGKFHDEQGVAYVWFAVFVLPVNSSVNPVLYTFSTPKVRTVLVGWFYCLVTRCKWFSCKKRSDGIAISDGDGTQLDTARYNSISLEVISSYPPSNN